MLWPTGGLVGPAGEPWVGEKSEQQLVICFPWPKREEDAGLCLFLCCLMVFLLMKKELWGVIMSLQGSSLGFSHPRPCTGHGGCWKVLCTPAAVSEHDQGAEDHESGAVQAAQPFRGQVSISKIPFQTWLRGSIWALGLEVFKARSKSDSGLQEKGMFAICFSSSFLRKGGGIHLLFVHVGSCFIVFCFVFPPTLQ